MKTDWSYGDFRSHSRREEEQSEKERGRHSGALVKNRPVTFAARKHSSFATLLHVINIKKTGNARINATLRCVRATNVALEK